MTTPTPLRSSYARHLALVGIVALAVTAVTLFAISSPLQDADARPAAAAEDTTASYADELLDAEVARARTAAEDAQTERLERFADAVIAAEAAATAERIERFAAAVAEAERVAAEQAAARAAEAAAASKASSNRSSMGGGWAALRRCESGGNYSAVSSSGAYRGAYQFSRSTWNAVARRSHPHLVGVDPAAAAPGDQDAMAMALYRSSGSSPWPHCGRHL